MARATSFELLTTPVNGPRRRDHDGPAYIGAGAQPPQKLGGVMQKSTVAGYYGSPPGRSRCVRFA